MRSFDSFQNANPAKPEAIYIVQARPDEKAYVNHIGYSIENFVAHKAAIEAELKRRNIKYHADTEWGWTLDDASGYTIHFISEKGIFPAVDPLASTSRILQPHIVGERHYKVARGVQKVLQRYKDLQDIIAILGVDELSDEDKRLVSRARRLVHC